MLTQTELPLCLDGILHPASHPRPGLVGGNLLLPAEIQYIHTERERKRERGRARGREIEDYPYVVYKAILPSLRVFCGDEGIEPERPQSVNDDVAIHPTPLLLLS